ncbi:MAG: DUF938 domain-containing protein, partial [Pseudomonadota bacterium]
MDWGWDNVRAVFGLALIVGIAFGLSENRSLFPWRIVLGAIALQFAFALLLFGVPPVRDVLFSANVIHIAPWSVAEGMVAGAGQALLPGGRLVLYGPFKEGGQHTGEGNV